MERAIDCKECGSVNLIENCKEDFATSCIQCQAPIKIPAEDIGRNTVVGNRYKILELLDEDNISNIYFATNLSTNDLVALRIFCWDYSYSITDPEEFLHLNESISLLAQPTHVKILDWGVDDDLLFTVWAGDSLESIKKLLTRHVTLEADVAVSIIKEAAECLSGIFDEIGVSHYTLNPQKIYLDSRGSVKLSELGFATQLFKDENFLDSGIEFYDWRYQAPEILLDWCSPDIRCDMFSLGYCLYTMITGAPPFSGVKPVSEVDYEKFNFTKADRLRLGETFMDLFYGLTATNPSERFHAWKDAINFMEYYLKEEALVARSSVVNRRRSLSTSLNINLCEDTRVPLPIIPKPIKKKPRALSAADIRLKSAFYVSKQPQKARDKTIRPFALEQKPQDTPMPIIIGVIAALIAVIIIIWIAKYKDSYTQRAKDSQPLIVTNII